MNPHRIRLGKPWQCETTPEGTCSTRWFHKPTGLGHGERVWIVVEGVAAPGHLVLNGDTLGELAEDGSPRRFEVTGRLLLRNELRVVLTGVSASVQKEVSRASVPGEVSLEIYSEEGEQTVAQG